MTFTAPRHGTASETRYYSEIVTSARYARAEESTREPNLSIMFSISKTDQTWPWRIPTQGMTGRSIGSSSVCAKIAMKMFAILIGCANSAKKNLLQRSGGTDSPPKIKRGFSFRALLGVFHDIPHIQTRACARDGRNWPEVRSVDGKDGS